MGMLDFDEAKGRISEYDYALIYMFDGIRLCRGQDVGSVDWGECLEARFFDSKGELRFWRDGNGYLAAEETCDGDAVEAKYELASGFDGMGKYLYVKRVLDYDEDGQAYVKATLLEGVGN